MGGRGIGAAESAAAGAVPTDIQVHRTLSYNIRNHAPMWQQESAMGQSLQVYFPPEYNIRPAFPQVSQHRPTSSGRSASEILQGEDWNYFTPPPIRDSFRLKPSRMRIFSRKRCTIAFAIAVSLTVVSLAIIFTGPTLDKQESPSVESATRLNSIAASPPGATSTLLISGIIRLPDEIESNIRELAFHTIPGLPSAVPFYLDVPLNGGKIVQQATEFCISLVEASNLGKDFQEETVRASSHQIIYNINPSKYTSRIVFTRS